MCFAELRAKYGPSINYARNRRAHVQAEFVSEIRQISKRRVASSAYFKSIGLKVPMPQLCCQIQRAARDSFWRLRGATDRCWLPRHLFASSGISVPLPSDAWRFVLWGFSLRRSALRRSPLTSRFFLVQAFHISASSNFTTCSGLAIKGFSHEAECFMRIVLVLVLVAYALPAQSPPPEQKDPLGRDTPRDAIFQFLEACHTRNYSKAQRYLDLRQMSPAERAKNGPGLARQLEDLLDDTPFDITMLSGDSEGDQLDNLAPNLERLESFQVGGQTLELQMERVQLRPGSYVWLVSAESIPLIPNAHQLIRESPLESKLPQPLVSLELFDTPAWRWIALISSLRYSG